MAVDAHTQAAAAAVAVAWSTPAQNASISGVARLTLTGSSFQNVEVFRNGTMLARAVVSSNGTLATADIDTTQLPTGALALTAHAWNSPPGTSYTSEADAGSRSFTIVRAPTNVTLAWNAPAQNTTVIGTAHLVLTGQALQNVEIFNGSSMLARATVSSDRTRATADIDTSALPVGPLVLTAHAWNSPPGQPFTSEADAGALNLVVQRPPQPTTVSLAWNAPAQNSTVSGTIHLRLTGQALQNVEIFRNATMLARATVSANGTVATADVAASQFPNGALTLTAHAWNSPPGQPFTSDADAGALNLVVTGSGGGGTGCRAGAPGHVAPTCVKNAYLGLGYGDTRVWAQNLGRAAIDLQEQWNDPSSQTGSAAQWSFMENLYTVEQYVVQANWPGKLSVAQPMWAGGRAGNESSGWNPFIGEGPAVCASGANDTHMRTILNKLKNDVGTDLYIRLGWEFNGNWYPDQNAWPGATAYNGNYKADWKACWIHWYDVIKSVSPNFKVVWNPNWTNRGTCYQSDSDPPFDTNILDYFPGKEYVDALGPDQYDGNCNGVVQDPNKRGIHGEPIGISAWADFAIAQGVPFAVPEWGVQNNQYGEGDRAQYITDMYNAFRKAHQSPSGLAYQSYFDGDRANYNCAFALVNPDCNGVNPNAKARYFQLFRTWPPQ